MKVSLGVAELGKYVSNCDVLERAPLELMRQYLASCTSIVPTSENAIEGWKHVYGRIGDDLSRHLFRSTKVAGHGKSAADTYSSSSCSKDMETWMALFPEGTAFGEAAAKKTHLYSLFVSDVLSRSGIIVSDIHNNAGIKNVITSAQEVMLFHMMSAPNIDVLLSDPYTPFNFNNLQRTLLPKNMVNAARRFKNEDASNVVHLADDVGTMISDCKYPLVENLTWVDVVLSQPKKVKAQMMAKTLPPPVPPTSVGKSVPVITEASVLPWTDDTERAFANKREWRAYKVQKGLRVFHPTKEAIRMYLEELRPTDITTVDKHKITHSELVQTILPHCNVGAVMDLPEVQAFYATQSGCGVLMTPQELVSRMLLAYHPKWVSTFYDNLGVDSRVLNRMEEYHKKNPVLTRDFVLTLLPS